MFAQAGPRTRPVFLYRCNPAHGPAGNNPGDIEKKLHEWQLPEWKLLNGAKVTAQEELMSHPTGISHVNGSRSLETDVRHAMIESRKSR